MMLNLGGLEKSTVKKTGKEIYPEIREGDFTLLQTFMLNNKHPRMETKDLHPPKGRV